MYKVWKLLKCEPIYKSKFEFSKVENKWDTT